MRLGIPKEYYVEGMQSGVSEAMKDAHKKLEELGATLEEVSLPHTPYALAVYYIIAPSSVEETFEFIQLAFHIADKYRVLAMVLTDFILGRMSEFIELKTFDFGPLPEKDWALKGKGKKNGKICDECKSNNLCCM